jgi:hypothetical protein
MFPTENQNPGAQVSGGDDEFNQFVRQTIQEEIARAQQPAATAANQPGAVQTQQPQPIQINLNGQTFSFQNQEELNRALNNTFSAYNQQLSQLQQTQSQPRGQEVSGQDEGPKLDINQFVEKLGTDPRAAFDMVDEVRFGMKNPAQTLREAVEKVNRQEQLLAAYQFKEQFPQFPANQQNAQALYGIMQQRGLPATAEGLEAAYAIGLMRGVFQPTQPQQSQFPGQAPPQTMTGQSPYAQPQMFQQNPYGGVHPGQFNGGMNFNQNQNPYLAPPPRAPRASSDAAPNPFDAAEDLSPEQIEAVFQRLQR